MPAFSKTSFFFIFLSFFISQMTFAQVAPPLIPKDELLFQKGLLLQRLATEGLGLNETIQEKSDEKKSAYAIEIKENILDDAFKYYQELTDSFPKSNRFYGALKNQAAIKLEVQDTILAEKLYRVILGKINEKDKKKTEEIVTADPNAVYKNNAALMLAKISLANREYQRALGFLEERKKYMHAGAGNGSGENTVSSAYLYAKCYIGLKKYQKAYDFLLPDLFSEDVDTDFYDVLYSALLKTYKKEELIKKYELAFKTCTIDKSKESYFIVFLNRKIDFITLLRPASIIEDTAYPGNEMDKIYKDSWFYKQLQSTEEEKKP